ncbi:hypothetical protein D0X99_18780 [Algoriphagus lacus]|uniref:SAP domain-containing protein n=1 Tax=Algoriphagus lacus TaxID=2056311 RepID=A0A418PMF1_9BACT|nr:SAP domain-containing protein [Algoriphagus lacus]RIW12558.1 hypothetical protein D0X99_18780 [Algoriphagus lacus]
MDFIKKFFRKQEEIIHPNFNYEIELLSILNGFSANPIFGLNTFWPERFKELLGDIDPIIKNFLSKDLLKINLEEESLSMVQLKEILQKNNLKTSGSKTELANRVREKIEDKSYLKGLSPLFKITDKGKELVKSYEDQFSKEYDLFLNQILKIILEGKIIEAEKEYFSLKSKFPDQRSLGGSLNKFGDCTLEILKYILEKKVPYFEGRFNELEKNTIREALIIFSITFPNFFNSEPTSFFIEKLKMIDFSLFRDKLSKSSRVSHKVLENPLRVIGYYLHYEYSYIYNLAEFSQIVEKSRSERFSTKYSGVQILNNGCECQEIFGEEKYEWSKIKSIPSIPRNGFCRCIYLPYY